MKLISIVILLLANLVSYTLADNLCELEELITNSKNHVIQIHNGDLSIINSINPRPFYTLLYLTSSNPKHECQLCAVLSPIINKISNIWYNENYILYKDLIFIVINLKDFSNSKIFGELKLTTIPHIWLIPPKFNANPESNSILNDPHYELNPPPLSEDQQINALNEFLNEHLSKNVIIQQQQQTNDQQLSRFFKTFLVTFSVIILIKKKGPSFITSTQKKTIVSIISILLIILFISGYQFTIQNKVPLLTKNNNDNSLVYISGGTHYQYGIEIFIIGANYLGLLLFFISLIKLGEYQINENSKFQNEKLRIWLIILNSMVIYILFSCLTSIVLRKDGGYPYPLTILF
ncbi:OST6 [Candida pseudojiufengensis]|uniref:OST6 n=1 Tax=Candida pseudojiufengensis TaxID=497109 RepID=UPI0022250224|nr:OST6 [Candida pseudojiufengensis]KAI5959174.1 OST6 [Candida pseudojiufengensis]